MAVAKVLPMCAKCSHY